MQIAARSFASSSHSRSRKEFFKASVAALQSNIGWGRWSSSSAVSSNSFTPQKGQKRVAKQERRAMVVAFVEKYRALNAGKFPTASIAKKQVGGSYYVIRGIIQELEYNHKRASPVKGALRTPVEEIEISREDLCSGASLQDSCSPERDQISYQVHKGRRMSWPNHSIFGAILNPWQLVSSICGRRHRLHC